MFCLDLRKPALPHYGPFCARTVQRPASSMVGVLFGAVPCMPCILHGSRGVAPFGVTGRPQLSQTSLNPEAHLQGRDHGPTLAGACGPRKAAAPSFLASPCSWLPGMFGGEVPLVPWPSTVRRPFHHAHVPCLQRSARPTGRLLHSAIARTQWQMADQHCTPRVPRFPIHTCNRKRCL